MKAKIDELYNTEVKVYETWRRHHSSLNTIKKFWKKAVLPIHIVDLEWIEKYDAWAFKVQKKAHNTVCGYHKDLKKYLGIAQRKYIIETNPYDGFKFKYEYGDRQALTQNEVKNLYTCFRMVSFQKTKQKPALAFYFPA